MFALVIERRGVCGGFGAGVGVVAKGEKGFRRVGRELVEIQWRVGGGLGIRRGDDGMGVVEAGLKG
jgi:hypothetical protein